MSVPAYLLDGSRYEHGTRARYNSAKCRCTPCRKANSRYENERVKRGVSNPFVSAAASRQHLRALTEQGIGLRSVSDAADVSRTILSDIRRGEQLHVRAETERRILAVDSQAVADGGLVDAAETWRLVRALIRDGFRKGDIAQRLGRQSPALQIRHGRVLARTALQVRKLYDVLVAEGEDAPVLDERPKARILRALRFFDWVSAEDLAEALEVAESDRNTFTVALGRMARAGEIERSKERVRGGFEYRSKRTA